MRALILIITLMLTQNEITAQDSLNFLKKGEIAPLFSVVDHWGDTIDLKEKLKSGKVVIVFYRGAWCPYCNRHMSDLQESLQMINNKGAFIIAVTPETDSSMQKLIAKTKTSFSIVNDRNYAIMKYYGVAFKMDDTTFKRYKLYGLDVEAANGNNDHILPVPATFIVNQNGTIEYVHFDTNYKERASVFEILKHL